MKLRILYLFLSLGVILNFGNSLGYFDYWNQLNVKVYLLSQIVLSLLAVLFLYKEYSREDGLVKGFISKLIHLPVPNGLKWLGGVILIIQLAHILTAQTIYPFADVGMFRNPRSAKTIYPKVLTLPKYFYFDKKREVQILELRKEHIFFMADALGFGYNNEYTFSANYHYKNNKNNFEFLAESVRKSIGVDTLWVGLQTVNYETGVVSFNSDLKQAAIFNDTATIYYGPIYVPDYQKKLLDN